MALIKKFFKKCPKKKTPYLFYIKSAGHYPFEDIYILKGIYSSEEKAEKRAECLFNIDYSYDKNKDKNEEFKKFMQHHIIILETNIDKDLYGLE